MWVGQWPTFHGPVILSYLEDYLMDKCCTGDIDWVWHIHWTETIYIGQWPIFCGPVILPYILKTIWWRNVIIGILDPCDADIPHTCKLYVGQWPTLMVQWFCLISWRPFDGGMLYWRYWFTATLSLTYIYIWNSDSALYFQYYLAPM